MSSSIRLERLPNGVFLLKMLAIENRFNPSFIAELHSALDTVEQSQGPCALVVTSEGKFFSNGLDLNWMGKNRSEIPLMLKSFMKIVARVLVFPVPTIAVLNGHAFAGGCMFSMAFDFRYMNESKGFMCMPEIDLHMALTPGMSAVMACKITNSNVLRDLVLIGKRYGGKECQAMQLVDFALPESELLQKALDYAGSIASKGDDRTTLKNLKSEMFKQPFTLLMSGDLGNVSLAKMCCQNGILFFFD